jgi:peptide/nickel transport system substrate-binding protein
MTERAGRRLTVLQPRAYVGDPHVMSDDRSRLSIIFSMYESLVRRGRSGAYEPSLAESWALNEDASTWKFELRPNVTFHNGDSLEAGDVVATLERVRDPGMGGELGTSGVYSSYLEGAQISALDKLTVEIVMPEPMADLLDLLVDLPIVPRSSLGGLPEQAIGSGPYRLVEANGDLVVMEAFSGYWGDHPKTAEVHWRAVPDAERRVAFLLANEADIISDVLPEGSQTIHDSAEAEVVSSQSTVCAIFICKVSSGVCADPRIRRALNYALDVDELVDTVMRGAAKPLNGPLTPNHFGYDPVEPYPHDPDKARMLLAEAGHRDGIRLVLDVPTTLPDEATVVAQLMARQFARAGIVTEVREFSDRTAYAEMVRDKQMDDAACFDSSPLSTYRIFREKLHSGVAGPWWQGYTNPSLDGLIDKARATRDDEARRNVYREAYRIIQGDAPWIFLYNPTLCWGVGPHARNFVPGVEGLIRPV